MLIILEGVDCSGKTTLATRLAELMNADILHRGPTDDDFSVIDEYMRPLDDYTLRDRHIICDRWHLGELVYGPYFRERSRIDVVDQAFIELSLKARGAVLAYLFADPDVIKARLRRDGDELVKPKHVDDLMLRYNGVLGTTTLPTLYFDTTTRVSSREVADLIAVARSFESSIMRRRNAVAFRD